MFGEYITPIVSVSIGAISSSLCTDNQQGVGEAGDGAHEGIIGMFCGFEHRVIGFVFLSKWRVANEVYGTRDVPSRMRNKFFQFSKCIFMIVPVIHIFAGSNRWNRRFSQKHFPLVNGPGDIGSGEEDMAALFRDSVHFCESRHG